MSGAMSGKWSFDPETNTLRLGTYKLCVARELDWEASPRKATIVYAGYSSNGKQTFRSFAVSDFFQQKRCEPGDLHP